MNKYFRSKKSRGFALLFAIFMTIGLETVIAGTMFGMMRFQREAQHHADEMRISWAAEAAAANHNIAAKSAEVRATSPIRVSI